MKRFCRLVVVLWAAPLWGRPAVTFDKTSFDFGDLPQGSTVAYNFTFWNTGNEPLRIEAVQSSCGCTAAAPSNPVVEPGAKAEIQVRYDSKGRLGETSKQIRVRTNDPDHPMTFLTIGGNVTPTVEQNNAEAQDKFSGTCSTCPVHGTEGRPSPSTPGSTPLMPKKQK